MDKQIIGVLNLFTLNQTITVRDEETIYFEGNVSMNGFGAAMSELCARFKIKNIHLIGEEKFATKAIHDFDKISAGKYSKKEVNIEVN